MKVHSTAQPPQITGAEQRANKRRGPAGGSAPGGDSVTLSPRASFVQSVRNEAAAQTGIRNDVVAATRAAIAAGTFENSIDMERVLDALMGEL